MSVSTTGARIAQARKAAGFRLVREFAAAMEVSESLVVRWENDHTVPGAKNLVAIARKCGVSTDYLLGLEAA